MHSEKEGWQMDRADRDPSSCLLQSTNSRYGGECPSHLRTDRVAALPLGRSPHKHDVSLEWRCFRRNSGTREGTGQEW